MQRSLFFHTQSTGIVNVSLLLHELNAEGRIFQAYFRESTGFGSDGLPEVLLLHFEQ